VFATDNGGRKWRSGPAGRDAPNAYLVSASCPTATTCDLVIGRQAYASFRDRQELRRTTDAGNTWETMHVEEGTDARHVRRIFCVRELTCLLLGSSGVSAPDQAVFLTRDGGHSFSDQHLNVSSTLLAVACAPPSGVNSLTCTATGDYETILGFKR